MYVIIYLIAIFLFFVLYRIVQGTVDCYWIHCQLQVDKQMIT